MLGAGFVLSGVGPAMGAGYVDVAVSARQSAAAINAVRAGARLPPLAAHPALAAAAAYQARLMAERDEISHRLGGQSLRSRVRRAGYPGFPGENLSAGRTSLGAVIEGWMASSGHRRNLLDPRFAEFGLAAARVPPGSPSRYRIYWALILGIPV